MTNPTKKNELVFNKLNDQLIIIDFKSSTQFHQVNEVGARIWELCDGHNTPDTMATTLAEEFEADIAEIKTDVLTFLEELKKNALINY